MNPSARAGLMVVLGVALIGMLFAVLWPGSGAKAGAHKHTSVSAGRTETVSTFTSSASTSSSQGATFNSQRVALALDDDLPLTRHIGRLLVKHLDDNPHIGAVEMLNTSRTGTDAGLAPDLFLRVGIIQHGSDGGLRKSMNAQVAVSLGNAPWRSSHFVQDSTTPPVVQYEWNGSLETRSAFTGVNTSWLEEIAGSISGELSKVISNQVASMSEKFPALPRLPDVFYGPYEPVEDFGFLKQAKARRVYSHYGLLTHNETFWKLQTGTNPVPLLKNLMSELEGAGWRSSDSALTNTLAYRVHLKRGDTELEVFSLRRDRLAPQEKSGAALELIARYRKPFSREQREVAFEKLFAEKLSVETLLPFHNSFSATQRERFFELAEKTPATSPLVYLQLAEHYLSQTQTNSARNMLLRAKALTVASSRSGSLDASIESVARKISQGGSAGLKVTSEACRQSGFVEITEDFINNEFSAELGQPLLLFQEKDGDLRTAALTVHPPRNGAYPYVLSQAREGTRSWSSSSFTPGPSGTWQQTFDFHGDWVKVTVVPSPGTSTVRYDVAMD